jgi:hypothetical protein
MEMIDVLNRLKEIQESQPGLVDDAVANVEKTNPKVDEGALKQQMHGDAEEMSREEFVKKYGQGSGDFWDNINGVEESKKEKIDESVMIATDSPEEASMMMKILKLAGVTPVDQNMINQQDGCGCDDSCPCGGQCEGNCDCENCGRQEENYANEPEEKMQSVDDLVNTHSGGLNRKKQTFPKVAGGDNPMQRTTEDLANSLRSQYQSFKENYNAEAKKAQSPYAIGMAQAMKSTGDKPPLEKSTIKKAHDIAKAVEKGK